MLAKAIPSVSRKEDHGIDSRKGRYIPLTFAVAASNKKEAVNKILGQDGSATVEDIRAIDYSEYEDLKEILLLQRLQRLYKIDQKNAILSVEFISRTLNQL